MIDWRWHALLVEPQREFRVRDLLVDQGHETFLPIRHTLIRRVLVARPQLPGYVFLGITPDVWPEWIDIMATPHVSGSIGPIHEPTMIQMIAGSSRVKPYGRRGRRRRSMAIVASGPYQDREVRIVQRPGEEMEIYAAHP